MNFFALCKRFVIKYATILLLINFLSVLKKKQSAPFLWTKPKHTQSLSWKKVQN